MEANWVNSKKIETVYSQTAMTFEKRKRKGVHKDIDVFGITPPYFKN